jgi:hypothetical protein
MGEFREQHPDDAAKYDEMMKKAGEMFQGFGIPPPAGWPGSKER